MSKLGSRLVQSAQEALAYANGGATEGFVNHRPIDVKATRSRLRLAQPGFAARFGLSLGTVRDWEQGRSGPDRPAQVLLRVIEAEPGLVQRVVETARQEPPADAAMHDAGDG
jgi:putative transcriptional regulator